MNNLFSLALEDAAIAYEIVRSPRIKKKLTLKVHRNGHVAVHAPKSISDKKAHEFVLQKTDWIKKQLLLFQTLPELKEHKWHYTQDELHYYLGQTYALHITIEPSKRQTVNLTEQALHICVQQQNTARIRAVLHAWYKYQANKIITERLQVIIPATAWIEKIPDFSIRIMQSRWGSCSIKQTLSFNALLIRAPLECIDYIIMHELCHFVEMNHGSRFYQLLSSICPQWRSFKRQLDELTPVILAI